MAIEAAKTAWKYLVAYMDAKKNEQLQSPGNTSENASGRKPKPGGTKKPKKTNNKQPKNPKNKGRKL